MDIGGVDIELEGKTSPDDVDFILRAIRAAWAQAVFQNNDGHTVMNPLRDLRGASEFFAYPDYDSMESWDRHGLTDWNADRTIYVIVCTDNITFVVDAKTSSTGALVTDIIEGLQNNRKRFGRH